jgi:hypothetical protein
LINSNLAHSLLNSGTAETLCGLCLATKLDLANVQAIHAFRDRLGGESLEILWDWKIEEENINGFEEAYDFSRRARHDEAGHRYVVVAPIGLSDLPSAKVRCGPRGDLAHLHHHFRLQLLDVLRDCVAVTAPAMKLGHFPTADKSL